MTLPRGYSQFAVYETFAPTALRDRSVVIAASDLVWRTELPPVLAMECARVGAHLTLAAPDRQVFSNVCREITAYGRPVLEVDATDVGSLAPSLADAAVAGALKAYQRLDLHVSIGPEAYRNTLHAACLAMSERDGGCVVAITGPAGLSGLREAVAALHAEFGPKRVRVNGVIAPIAVEDAGGPPAQDVAWRTIFLASPAGVSIAGQVLGVAQG
jgi:hypothetical protein